MNTLSTHFTETEFIHSNTAQRHNINNYFVNTEHKKNAQYLCSEYLEYIRHYVLHKQPLILTSGYRTPTLNKLINGSPTSNHTKGLAVDFISRTLSLQKIYKTIIQLTRCKLLKPFDQIYLSKYNYIHYGIRPPNQAPRRQVLNSTGSKVLFTINSQASILQH